MENILYLKTTDSTNIAAHHLAQEGAGHGSAVLAEHQEKGSGRSGRNWQSAAGKGLYCSIILRPAVERISYPQLTLVAGVAVAAALIRLAQVSISLKWPNDIYLARKKCGGILSEASFDTVPEGDYLIVGIGINLNHTKQDFSQEICEQAVSLYQFTGREFSFREVFPVVRDELLLAVARYQQSGLAPLLRQWRQHDSFVGEELQWAAPAGEKIIGKSQGVDEQGALLLMDLHGTLHRITAGDVQPAALGIGLTDGQ